MVSSVMNRAKKKKKKLTDFFIKLHAIIFRFDGENTLK